MFGEDLSVIPVMVWRKKRTSVDEVSDNDVSRRKEREEKHERFLNKMEIFS